MVYAQILNNIVQNIIILNNPNLVSVFTQDYDYCIRIDNISDINGNDINIGWVYDGTHFSPPN